MRPLLDTGTALMMGGGKSEEGDGTEGVLNGDEAVVLDGTGIECVGCFFSGPLGNNF